MIRRGVGSSLDAAGECTIWVSSCQYKFYWNFSDSCRYFRRDNIEIVIYFGSSIVSIEDLYLFDHISVGNNGKRRSVIDQVKYNGNNNGSRLSFFGSQNDLLLSLEV